MSLGEKFRRTSEINPTISYARPRNGSFTFPFISRQYSTVSIDSLHTVSGMRSNNNLFLTNSVVQQYTLPHPYDTKCIPLHYGAYFKCKRSCLSDAFRQHFNRAPCSVALDQEIDLCPISPADLQDQSARDKYAGITKTCEDACAYVPCSLQFTVTSVTAGERFNDSGLFVNVLMPQYALRSTHSVPVMTFIDYFSFTCSCFGTWFGISFLSLDPTRLQRKVKNSNFSLLGRFRSQTLNQAPNHIVHHHVHHVIHHSTSSCSLQR